MTLTTTFKSETFSASLPDIVITTDRTRVRVVMVLGSDTLYDELLYPDTDGKIEIIDLPMIVTPYIRKKLAATLTVTLTEQAVATTDDSETATDIDVCTLTTTLRYCAARISEDAATFCAAHFLTLLQGVKTTAAGRLEYLHYTGTDTASVAALYADGTSAAFTPTTVGSGTVQTIDVSPQNFETSGKTLVGYTVRAGDRAQQFDIDFNAPDCAPVLLFINSFGCQDIIYCAGTHTVSPEFKFSSAYIGSDMRNYDIEETRTFKADTGVLTFPMAHWLSDLFRSDEVQLLNFNEGTPTPGNYVVITEAKPEYNNDLDSQPRFTFEYRYAQRNQNVLDLSREGRIFDNTFDYTFN